MTDLDKWLEEGEALEKAATKGPWAMQDAGLDFPAPVVVTDGKAHAGTFVCECNEADDGTAEKDARFIADARTRVAKQREIIRVMREALGDVRKRTAWRLQKLQRDADVAANLEAVDAALAEADRLAGET